MRKYKKISECPVELEEIIELVNLLPKNGVQEIFRKITYREMGREEAATILPERIITYAFDRSVDARTMMGLTDLATANILLPFYAKWSREYGAVWADAHKDIRFSIRLKFLSELGQLNVPTFPERLELTDDGFIKPNKRQFTDIFDENSIPFYRIRSCPICNSIYWAKRTDAEACNKKNCSDILAQRKYQAKKREKNAQRKSNRGVVKNGVAKTTKRRD